MVASGKVRLRRFAVGMGAGCGATWLAAVLFGPLAATIVIVAAILASTFVADDGVGTFFPLAVMFVLAIALLMLVLFATVALNL